MAIYTTRDGDVLDKICQFHYGGTGDHLDSVFEANPNLAAQGPIYPAGLKITLPDLPPQTTTAPIIRLWD